MPKAVKQRAAKQQHVACKQGERPVRVGLETDAVQMFLNENSRLKAEGGFRHSSNLFLWGKATKREGSGLQIGFGEISGALRPKCWPASGCEGRSGSGADPARWCGGGEVAIASRGVERAEGVGDRLSSASSGLFHLSRDLPSTK